MKPLDNETPQPKYRKDYTPPAYRVEHIDLRFEIWPEETIVEAKLSIHREDGVAKDVPLVLDGESLELQRVAIDGQDLKPEQFAYENDQLRVDGVPANFELQTKVRIFPKKNTELSGLYASGGMFCTQCEAEGFRRITFFTDRPDVLAVWSTTIVAEQQVCPVLLSNGNLEDKGQLDDGRHWVRWRDPFKKPSYLFALVAGQLECVRGEFVTRTGRAVKLEVWVEPENIDKCDHALASLKRAMKWDEDVYGLEYDLDIYMIVAVRDFNMGAMENKGLNVFNAKYVLAKPETATDDDYENIEGVIGHEYFHNWTGNRVTCRDWFQLTLKEGLTVFRDQLFTADMTSAPVKRISDVRLLRTVQFEEDSGPMAHPIRPDSYIAMDNFYTATVYIKGAEIIRMYHTILGAAGFRRGMDLYFERHDGTAVTCDDFYSAMVDANEIDLSGLMRWYEQAGTPTLSVSERYDVASKRYELTLSQSREDMVGHAKYEPCLVPVKVGLLGGAGEALTLRDADKEFGKERVLELRELEQSFVFESIEERPVVSLLRDFSAPVKLNMTRSEEDLAFLFAHDSNTFNRWDAGQTLARRVILELVTKPETEVDTTFVAAYGRMLDDESLDGSLKALAMALPSVRLLAQHVSEIDPERIHQARESVFEVLAQTHEEKLSKLLRQHPRLTYKVDKESIGSRRLRNAALRLLSSRGGTYVELVEEQLNSSDNMTDAYVALCILVDLGGERADAAIETFYASWKNEPLVLDKWFTAQALSKHPSTFQRVEALRSHPDFTLDNPNRVRSLVGAFTMNLPQFHAVDGRAYVFLADQVEALHAKNPQLASRLVAAFNGWRRYESKRRDLMKAQLERLSGISALSKDVFEIVQRALGSHESE